MCNNMVTAGLSEELERRITTVIRAAPINSSKSHSDLYYSNDIMMMSSDVASLGAIKDQLPAEVDYWHIKMTISLLQVSTNYRRPGNNKTPSNSNTTYKKTTQLYSSQSKRHLPSWNTYKSSKRSRKFF